LDSEHLLGDAQQGGSPMSREEEIRAGLFDHTLNGHAPEVKALTEEGLSLGMDPMDILFKALIPSLEEVGRRFEKGDFFVPEMLIAARAMQGALVILRPLIAETGAQPVGRYVIGTVKGDIHDIGKNLCVIMLEGAGFEVYDLGVNTPPEKFVAAIQEHKPDVIGFSAFLTTTMPMFKVNIEAITKAGLRDKVHIAVGGAPVTEEYAKHVGADSYAPDASMATRMAKEIVGDRSQSSEGAKALEQAVMKIDETLRKG
jgi:methylmalonyl-CoA mutase cobalamin-binding domain/chain